MGQLKLLQEQVHQLAVDKGWYEQDRNLGEQVMLIVTELSEAVEELRKGYEPTDVYYHIGHIKPEGFGIELADAVIRILDLCEAEGIDIEKLIAIKHGYNTTRPPKHGKKF